MGRSVASHTSEIASVTEGAGGLIQLHFSGTVGVHEMGNFGVSGRAQLGIPGVAIPAGEWGFNRRMADQTVGHLRQRRARDPVRLCETVMASLAGIVRSQAAADPGGSIARRLQVVLVVDGSGQERRDITHFQVQCMTEMGEVGGGRRRNLDVGVAAQTDLFRRQEVVLNLRAARRRFVTGDALHPHAKVEAMRKRRSAPGGGTRESYQ